MRVIWRSPDPLARMHTMTKGQGKSGTIDIRAVLAEDEEFLRALVRMALQEVLEAEMTEALGAEKGERASGRQRYRSGYYGRTLITRVGQAGAAGAAGSQRAVLDLAVRTVSALGAGAGGGAGVQSQMHQRALPCRCLRQRRDRVTETLAPVGPQGSPARRAARLMAVAARSRGSLLWTTGTSCAIAGISRSSLQ